MFWPSRSACCAAVLRQQADHALVFAELAEAAYDSGSRTWAGLLHAAAERFHCVILAGIANLSDEEADALEPAVTRLENRLSSMWPLGDPPNSQGEIEVATGSLLP